MALRSAVTMQHSKKHFLARPSARKLWRAECGYPCAFYMDAV